MSCISRDVHVQLRQASFNAAFNSLMDVHLF